MASLEKRVFGGINCGVVGIKSIYVKSSTCEDIDWIARNIKSLEIIKERGTAFVSNGTEL